MDGLPSTSAENDPRATHLQSSSLSALTAPHESNKKTVQPLSRVSTKSLPEISPGVFTRISPVLSAKHNEGSSSSDAVSPCELNGIEIRICSESEPDWKMEIEWPRARRGPARGKELVLGRVLNPKPFPDYCVHFCPGPARGKELVEKEQKYDMNRYQLG
jgi:hypothetical protein